MAHVGDRDRTRKALGALRGLPGFPTAMLVASVGIVIGVGIAQNVLAGLVAAAFLLIGLWGSYILGSTRHGGAPPVKQSFRHLARLRLQLAALTQRMAQERSALTGTTEADIERARMSLSAAEFVLEQYVGVVDDAMEAWAELAPEDVEELRSELQRSGQAAEAAEEVDVAEVYEDEVLEIYPDEKEDQE